MDSMYIFRSNIISLYRKNENIINACLKFAVTFLMSMLLSGLSAGAVSGFIAVAVSAAVGVFAIVVPAGAYCVMFALLASAFAAAASVEVGILTFLITFIVLVFIVRIIPRQSLLIIAVIAGFYFKVPYLAVVFAGMYAGLSGVVPVAAGVFLYYLGREIPSLAALAPASEFTPLGVMDGFLNIYVRFFEIISDSADCIAVALIFSLAVLVVWVISQMSFDYSREFTPVAGGLIIIIGFIICTALNITEDNILLVIIFTIVSVLAAEIFRFMETILDYSGAQRVQFEDNNYYYYVKLVPKIDAGAEYISRDEADEDE